MNRPILVAAMALVCCGQAAACDCDPDSLAFQDTFFKYCDQARAAYLFPPPLASVAADGDAVAGESEKSAGPDRQTPERSSGNFAPVY